MAEPVFEHRSDQVARLLHSGLGNVIGVDRLEGELVEAEERGARRVLGQEYLSVDEAAAYARVCRRSVYNWMNSGKLAFTTSPSGIRLIRRSDITKGSDS
jgi:excisionase family DNA binding protein